MGRGRGGHTFMKTYTREEGSPGGEIYTQTNTQTHIQKHTQTHVQTHTDTHTDTHTVFSPFRGAYIYIWDLWTSRELAVAK